MGAYGGSTRLAASPSPRQQWPTEWCTSELPRGKCMPSTPTSGYPWWQYSTAGTHNTAPAVANGVVYIGSQYPDQAVYALDAFTGAFRWKYPLVAFYVDQPAVANGVVYVTGEDDQLYAVSASTGALLWKYQGLFSPPVVANGMVYVGSYNGDGVLAFGLPKQ